MAMVCAVILAIPMSVLPTKDSVEELFFMRWKGIHMGKMGNILVTIAIVMSSLIVALLIPKVSDAIAFFGVTTNPFVRGTPFNV